LVVRGIEFVIFVGVFDGFLPGFAAKSRGPLSEDQIQSLVEYLSSIRQQ
jgi:hypothetical protein